MAPLITAEPAVTDDEGAIFKTLHDSQTGFKRNLALCCHQNLFLHKMRREMSEEKFCNLAFVSKFMWQQLHSPNRSREDRKTPPLQEECTLQVASFMAERSWHLSSRVRVPRKASAEQIFWTPSNFRGAPSLGRLSRALCKVSTAWDCSELVFATISSC